MEIFGGFMMMMSIIGFFLVVIWFILPFVIFNIKGRVDRSIDMLEELDRRLQRIESELLERRTPPPAEEERPIQPPL